MDVSCVLFFFCDMRGIWKGLREFVSWFGIVLLIDEELIWDCYLCFRFALGVGVSKFMVRFFFRGVYLKNIGGIEVWFVLS